MANRKLGRRFQRLVVKTAVFIFLTFLFSSLFTKLNHVKVQFFRSPLPEAWYNGVYFKVPEIEGQRKDWHDYAGKVADSYRVGLGENGNAVFDSDFPKNELKRQMARKYGYNTFLSDSISINRSVPDVRHEDCRSKRYLAHLPTVSVIIPCSNEHESVLKRTLHSIYNRTPRSLLKEIIIIDDNSQHGYSVDKMILYVEDQFPNLVKFIRLPERKGLIYAKQRGAKIAIGEVLVFLECHIECNYNWLPPLLDPIAVDDRISTSPIIDTVKYDTFLYKNTSAWRGGFIFSLKTYIKHGMSYKTYAERSIPFKDSVMMGGLFAISRRFFWELGGYDDKLDIWGSEQYELSFKIWMCGGMLLVIPCSRVGHLFRGYYWQKDLSVRGYDFLATNIKRVAEVWMDEYKYYLREDWPLEYDNLYAGDLTEQHALRKRLHCRSFKWYLEVIAPHCLGQYKIFDLPDFAKGALQSVEFEEYCLDTLQGAHGSYVGVYTCANNLLKPQRPQYWHLNSLNEMRNHRSSICLDKYESRPNGKVKLLHCHGKGGNQFWTYNKKYKWLQHRKDARNCLEILKTKAKFLVVVNRCKKNNKRMRWNFAYVNDTAFAFQNVTSHVKLT